MTAVMVAATINGIDRQCLSQGNGTRSKVATTVVVVVMMIMKVLGVIVVLVLMVPTYDIGAAGGSVCGGGNGLKEDLVW